MFSWARAFVEEMQALNRKLNQHDNEDENLESLEEPIPTWARALMEEMDQIDMRLQKLESQDESDSWEDNSPQIEIPDEPINDYPHFSNFVPSSDHYLRDMIDYHSNEVKVDTPMSKEVNDLKEYLNEDMISSLPKTIPCINPTPRSNSTIRCYKCRKVGHVKANCSKMIIVLDDSNPLPHLINLTRLIAVGLHRSIFIDRSRSTGIDRSHSRSTAILPPVDLFRSWGERRRGGVIFSLLPWEREGGPTQWEGV